MKLANWRRQLSLNFCLFAPAVLNGILLCGALRLPSSRPLSTIYVKLSLLKSRYAVTKLISTKWVGSDEQRRPKLADMRCDWTVIAFHQAQPPCDQALARFRSVANMRLPDPQLHVQLACALEGGWLRSN